MQYPGQEDHDDIAQRLVAGPIGTSTPPETASKQGVSKPEAPKDQLSREEWEALTSAEQRAYNLRQFKLTEDDVRSIQRAILRRGFWSREYKMWNGELVLTLRNPHGEHRLRRARMFDRLESPTNLMVSEATSRIDLAGSLLSYDDGETRHVFTFPERAEKDDQKLEDMFNERYRFISEIDPQIQVHLFTAHNHFTNLIAAALANGAVESF